MKNILKTAAITALLFTTNISTAQVHWGFDIRFGNYPPPREVIIERPNYDPDLIWVPGYYVYRPREVRCEWVRGCWQHRPPRGARWEAPGYYGEYQGYGHRWGRWKEGRWR